MANVQLEDLVLPCIGSKELISAEDMDELFKKSEQQLQEENEMVTHAAVVYKDSSMDTQVLVK